MRESKNLRSFNLNTLPILHEILLQGSVSKAAIKLNVSQPALSAALKQLRLQFDDELLIRSGGSMGLTPKAKALLAPLEQALSVVQQLITPSAENSDQPPTPVRIATNDYVMNSLGTSLTQLLLQEKPEFTPLFLSAGGQTPLQLINGDIDLVICPKQIVAGSNVNARDQDSMNSEFLAAEALVGIGRGNDEDLARGLSVEEYLARPHVSFDTDCERNITVEQAFLAAHSLRQNNIARFSCYTPLLGIVASTQCIGLVPIGLAQAVKNTFGLSIFTPPIAFPPMDWTMIWHRRNDKDDKFAQFRAILKSCVGFAAGNSSNK